MKEITYHKDPQEAFQQAQEGTKGVNDVLQKLDHTSSAYGAQLKHLKHGIEEAYQQIENAMEVASEHQRIQLEHFQQDLQRIEQSIQE